jgi:Xaa-Pro aminopeptidase
MQTMHPTLLIGPGDWDPRQIPREDYNDRLAAVWRDHDDAGGVLVYGNSHDHGALAYLTHFTPKLEAALALIPRHGEPQMLIGGGVNMLQAAKPLTFISTLAPLRDAATSAANWARGLDAGTSFVLIGGDAMPYDLRHALDRALGAGQRVETGDAPLQAHMRKKSPRELRIMRQACVILDAAVAALRDSVREGKSITDAVLSAEYTALKRGAQDVRSLFSLDGGRTLRPFDVPVAQRCDSLQVYLAVRHDGYWAEGFVRTALPEDQLRSKAGTILRAMVAKAKAGMSCRQLQQIVDATSGTSKLHPLADGVFGSSTGLSLDEPPVLTRGSDTTLEQDAVYSLRAGLVDETGAGAIISTMVAVTVDGCEILWPGGLS